MNPDVDFVWNDPPLSTSPGSLNSDGTEFTLLSKEKEGNAFCSVLKILVAEPVAVIGN